MANDVEPVIVAHGLRKVFGAGNTQVVAVDGVDLSVLPGELVLIMGPSGSGKTTLLSMIGTLLRPSAGMLSVAGYDLTTLSERQLGAIRRDTIGFVFQSFNLLEALTIEENVEVVLNLAGKGGKEVRDRAVAMLRTLGLGARLGFRPSALSGGEKQRVSIARALVHDPRVLLADEPTANLDSKNGHAVMTLLHRLALDEGRAVLVVSHDERLRAVADRVLWLEDGKLIDVGRLEEDPVCRMNVETSRAQTAEYQGETVFFCSAGCRTEFLADPGAFPIARRPR